MKKMFLVLMVLLANTFSVSPASSADTCTQLNTPAQADDLLTVTMLSVSVLEKTGSSQLTISYKQTNNTADKKLDEGSFSLFFADGTGMPQYGFFNYFFPGDSRQRTYTWEYLKSQNPIAITYNPGFFAQSPSANKLSWAIPGKACQISVLNDKAAADKAAADKAAADKAAADKAAADKAGLSAAAAAAATDAANAATDAANIAAEAIEPETATFLDELDLAIQKAKVNGVKTELNYKKVLKDTQVKLIQIQTKRAQAETLAEKSLASSNDKSLSADTQRMYASANRSWTSTVRALVSVENQLKQRIERISNSQDLVNKAVEDFQKSKSASGSTGTSVEKTTITCVKGKHTKKVTTVKPKCPIGYKVKK